jgi:hypothetical protein
MAAACRLPQTPPLEIRRAPAFCFDLDQPRNPLANPEFVIRLGPTTVRFSAWASPTGEADEGATTAATPTPAVRARATETPAIRVEMRGA